MRPAPTKASKLPVPILVDKDVSRLEIAVDKLVFVMEVQYCRANVENDVVASLERVAGLGTTF